MSLYRQAGSSKQPPSVRTTEFDVLKASHKFLRDDDETADGALSWEDQLAKKYYSSLFREFAVCDLKHYKSGNFALRWRTEAEVLAGAGEETCGNTRCTHHAASAAAGARTGPPLRTVELPFAYEERGAQKAALVKVVLCDGCLRKLMWKREKGKGKGKGRGDAEDNVGAKSTGEGERGGGTRRERREPERARRRSSRSLSPSTHRRHEKAHEHRHRGRSPPPPKEKQARSSESN
ncbi:folate-sensitive fragile site protein Fra10Ac1-domain-containing protein [Phellopilus nigrolimitatus]|nr:folate-sensitive fragile site protein Fra10Ac1-domain-containing protein [Phellopilus nigrolimitatus]